MKEINAYNLRCTCESCPTQYEFEDKENRHYYFRYRWGHWSLSDITNDNWIELVGGDFGDCLDGECSKKQFLKLLKDNGYKIIIKDKEDKNEFRSR